MIMDVMAVCVGGDEKGVVALRPAHSRFIAHPVCLLRGDLPRTEGLPDLIAQHIRIPPLLPARDGLVLCLCQQELGVGCAVVALIGGNELPALGFLRVLSVVETVFQGLGNSFPLLIWLVIKRVVAVSSPPPDRRKEGGGNIPAARHFWTKCPEVIS